MESPTSYCYGLFWILSMNSLFIHQNFCLVTVAACKRSEEELFGYKFERQGLSPKRSRGSVIRVQGRLSKKEKADRNNSHNYESWVRAMYEKCVPHTWKWWYDVGANKNKTCGHLVHLLLFLNSTLWSTNAVGFRARWSLELLLLVSSKTCIIPSHGTAFIVWSNKWKEKCTWNGKILREKGWGHLLCLVNMQIIYAYLFPVGHRQGSHYLSPWLNRYWKKRDFF